MFSGVGGFEVGIEEACAKSDVKQHGREHQAENSRCGFGVEPRRDGQLSGHHGVQCIGFSEIDRYAVSIYRRHFPDHKNFGDATELDPGELPDFDLLVGGFPCQAFSIAGKRAGFLDARGTLFFEIARVLEYKRPRYFLLENVEGLLSHDDRKTIVAIIRVLSDLGYRVSWQVLNTKDYGLPQNRERIFIAGRFGGGRGPEVFPVAETCGEVGDIRGKELMEITQNQSQGFRVYDPMGIATTVASGAGGLGAKTGLYALEVANAVTSSAYLQRGERERIDGKPSKEPTPEWKRRIRRLTPTECERLQGFPDGWTEYGIDKNGKKIPISDTQRYKCLGNAVSTNVIARIISGWKELTS